MAVNLNPTLKTDNVQDTKVQTAPVSQPVTQIKAEAKPDTVELSQNQAKPEKRGIITSFKDAYTNVKKFFITTGNMIEGAAKGIVYGTIAGGAVLGGAAIKNLIKRAPKTLSVKNKFLAGAVAATFVAGNLIAAKLNANEKNANVDHRWQTGHNAN